MAEIQLGLTFDDVLLLPCLSSILPGEADPSSQLLAGFPLRLPILSAPMDTVTESDMAIAMAREGGLGVIHRNNRIDDQAAMVAKVKRFENAVITRPITVSSDMRLSQVKSIMLEHGFSGFPVVDADNKLEGIITGRDMRVFDGHDLDTMRVADVMTPLARLITGAPNTTPEEARKILYRNRIEKLPLVDASGHLAGLITDTDIRKREAFQESTKDELGRLRCGAAVGPGPEFHDRAQALVEAGADALFIDAATGHTTRVLHVIEKLRESFNLPVVAGNVVTQDGARDLIAAGASAIKVGVGPGSICTTRIISGVGMPQFSAIQEVAKVARPAGVSVIADGGIRYSGDAVKALAAGADLIMMGGMLAGCEESPGAVVHYQGRNFKTYRGMGSLGAMRAGSSDRYGQNASGKLVAEGVEARVPYKGMLADVIFQLVGGLRSGMGYLGAKNLDELREHARFVRITTGGLKESHPHDVTITEEPGNYSR
ncbi:MAG TPA: IMP dehydrogenase [Candidatus Akkermansia intestinigallinarum]|uniref:Inosine-5'-monophosphate dehydrogenase n=1 Tax=Candidatus Akkermansia intestinigallinarum TaxID=2838431 RepID=A0A9D1VA55_9BACT|nr:IMP dehydrogenase [Candidatus Akkermansia intestinigallinarum]